MGWTFTHREKGEATNAEWFAREFSGAEFLEHATVGGTFYAAARRKDQPDGEVFALVCLTRWVRGFHNFGYKDMDETMGPYESNAPEKILRALTPTTSEYALEWRLRCEENLKRKKAAAKVKPGTVLKFATPIRFTSGIACDALEFVSRNTFKMPGGTARFRLPGWREGRYPYTIVERDGEHWKPVTV